MYIKCKKILYNILIIFAFIFSFYLISDTSNSVYASVKEYNDFCLTSYCPCRSCSEGYGTMTASGRRAKVNHTIAVDRKVIPLYSKVVIEGIDGIIFVAEDVGGAIKNHKIDIYVANHSDTYSSKFNTNGKHNRKIRVYSSDTPDSQIEDFSKNSGLSSSSGSGSSSNSSSNSNAIPTKSDGSIDYTQIGANTVKEIIQAEKYNFNKVKYSVRTANKYKNGTIDKEGSVKELSDFEKNHTITDTGLKIPSLSTYYIDPDATEKDKEEVYLNLISPYMQKWFIPYTMMVDTADEDYVLGKVMGEMYHPVNVRLFALNKLTKTTEKRYYLKCEVTIYSISTDAQGNKRRTRVRNYISDTGKDPSSSASETKEVRVINEQARLADTKQNKDYSVERYVPKIVYAGSFYEVIDASFKVEAINENDSPNSSNESELEINGDYGTTTLVEEWEEGITDDDYQTNTYKLSYYDEEDYSSLGRRISRIEWYQDYNNYLHKSDSKNPEDKNKLNDMFPKKDLDKTDEIKLIPSLKETYEKYKDAYGYDDVYFAYSKIEEMYQKLEEEATKNALDNFGPCFTFPIPAYVGKKKLSQITMSEVSPLRTLTVNGVVQNAAHTGTDLADGTSPDIVAAGAGKVIEAGFNAGGYGNYVKIQHDNGYTTLYGHMRDTPLVKTGDTVQEGRKLGDMGTTGNSTGVHLHFEIIDDALSGMDRYKKVSEFFDEDLNPICSLGCEGSDCSGIVTKENAEKLRKTLDFSFISDKNRRSLIEYIAPYAILAQKEYNILPSILISQAINEGGWDRISLYKRIEEGKEKRPSGTKSIFGITNSGEGTGYQDGTGDMAASVNTYGKFLNKNSRYKKLLALSKSSTDSRTKYITGANIIAQAGWCYTIETSGGKITGQAAYNMYESRLKSSAKSFSLWKFDDLSIASTGIGTSTSGKGRKVVLSPSNQTSNDYTGVKTTEHKVAMKIAESAKSKLQKKGYSVKIVSNPNPNNRKVLDNVKDGLKWLSGSKGIYIAIHTNASGGGARGPLTFYRKGNSDSKKLATEVQKSLWELYKSSNVYKSSYKNQGISGASHINEPKYFYEQKGKGAAVLTEVAFHDIKNEAIWINSNTDKIADALVRAIDNYK